MADLPDTLPASVVATLPSAPPAAANSLPDTLSADEVAKFTTTAPDAAPATLSPQQVQGSAVSQNDYLAGLSPNQIVSAVSTLPQGVDQKPYIDAYVAKKATRFKNVDSNITPVDESNAYHEAGPGFIASVGNGITSLAQGLWKNYRTVGNLGFDVVNEALHTETPEELAQAKKDFGTAALGTQIAAANTLNLLRKGVNTIADYVTETGRAAGKLLPDAAPVLDSQKTRYTNQFYDDLFAQKKLNAIGQGQGQFGKDLATQGGAMVDPAQANLYAQSPLADPISDAMFFIPGAKTGAALAGAGEAADAVGTAARVLKTTAEVDAANAAAKAADIASKTVDPLPGAQFINRGVQAAANTIKNVVGKVDTSTTFRAALGGALAGEASDFDPKSTLAGAVGAAVLGGKVKLATATLGKVASIAADISGKLAGQEALGPVGQFARRAYGLAGEQTKSFVAAQLYNTPFLLGVDNEDDLKSTLVSNAILHGAGVAVGAGATAASKRLINGLNISKNYFAPTETSPEVRLPVKAIGLDPALDAAHSSLVDGLDNSSNNFVETIRSALAKKGQQMYVLNQPDYEAAIDRAVKAGQITPEDAATAKNSNGVKYTVNDDGTPTNVSLSSVRPAQAGLSTGHEAMHLLTDTLSPEEKLDLENKVRLAVPSQTLADFKNSYEDQVRRSGTPNYTLPEDQIIPEYMAEMGAAVLNSVPLTPNGISEPVSRIIHGYVLRGLEGIGLKTPKAVDPALVQDGVLRTPLGLDTNAKTARVIQNVLQARLFDAESLRGTPADPIDRTLEQTPAATTKQAPTKPTAAKPTAPVTPVSEFPPHPVTDKTPEGAPARPARKNTHATVPDYSRPLPAGDEVSTQTPVSTTSETAPTVKTPLENVRVTPEKQNELAGVDPAIKAKNLDYFTRVAATPRDQHVPVEVEYNAAKTDAFSPDQIIREKQRRLADAADAEAKRTGVPNPLRKVYQKITVPYDVRGKQVLGMSVDKVLQNADLLRGFIYSRPGTEKLIDPSYLKSPELIKDLGVYSENQANGYAGDGRSLERPANAREGSIVAENPDYEPQSLPQHTADILNLLMGQEQTKKQTPGTEFAKQFAELNKKKVGTVKEVSDTNPLRTELRNSHGFDERVLNSAVERLNLDRITSEVKPRPDLNFHAGDTAIQQAGFQPRTDGPIAAATDPEKLASVKQALADPKTKALYSVYDRNSLPKSRANRVLQVDLVSPHGPRDGYSSTSTELLNELGYKTPHIPENLPQGQYTAEQIARHPSSASFQPRTDATSKDFDKENIHDLLQKKNWPILTAENPNAKELSPRENAQRNAALEKDLKAAGYDVEPVKGKYGGNEENSFRVLGISPEEASALGKKYGQESVLTPEGLRYQDGSVQPATGVTAFDKAPDDFYTKLPNGQHFAVNIDFDAPRIPAEEPVTANFQPATNLPLAGTKLPESIKDKSLSLVHYGSLGQTKVTPEFFDKSGLTPRSELAGAPRSYFYEKGKENKYDPVLGRSGKLATEISGSKIYDGDKDPLGYSSMVNREKADDMLKEKGYEGIARTGGSGKSKYRQVELFKPVKVAPSLQPRIDGVVPATPETPFADLQKANYWLSPEGKFFPVPRDEYHEQWAEKSTPIGEGKDYASEELYAKGWKRVNAGRMTANELFSNGGDSVSPKQAKALKDAAIQLDLGRATYYGDKSSPKTLYGTPASFQPQTETKEFKKFSEGAPLIKSRDHNFKSGEPVVVEAYHGTQHDFEAFDKSKASPEGDSGAGFYFTNTIEDVNNNYHAAGADYTNKLERLKDQILALDNTLYEDGAALAIAREILGQQHDGAVMKSYVKFKNPAVIGGTHETFLEYETSPEGREEGFDFEGSGTLGKFINSVADQADKSGGNGQQIRSDLIESTADGFASLRSLWDKAKESEGLMYAEDKNGNFISTEILRKATETAGFDGIIDRSVYTKFGPKKGGRGLQGMLPNTVHFIAFEPTQIKSATGNRGTFDPTDPRVNYQPATDVKGYREVARYLTDDEKSEVRSNLAKNMVDLAKSFPPDSEFEAASILGSAKKGWYQRAADTLRGIFGPDTEKFVSLLAATSPRQSVEANLVMSLEVWKDWNEAGRPTDPAVLKEKFAKPVELEARLNNVVRALTGKDLEDTPITKNKQLNSGTQLSGFKVESFRRNLLGDLAHSTNDAWMAQFAGIPQSKFVTKAGYLAFTSKIRRVADKLGIAPAEAQETIWSFFKTLVEKSNVDTTAHDELTKLTNRDIQSTPEFHDLLVSNPDIISLLGQLGFPADKLADLGHPTAAGGSDSDTRPLVKTSGLNHRVLERISARAQKIRDLEREGAPQESQDGDNPF